MFTGQTKTDYQREYMRNYRKNKGIVKSGVFDVKNNAQDAVGFTNTTRADVRPPLDLVRPPLDLVRPPLDLVRPPLDLVRPPLDLVRPPLDLVRPPLDLDGNVIPEY